MFCISSEATKMTNSASVTFIDWLNSKLRELNTDESVFGAYIVGILEGDETEEEKTDAVEGILSEILENHLQESVTEILAKWYECHPKDVQISKSPLDIDVNEQLAKLLEAQKLPTVKERKLTEEQRKIKQQILAQYSQTEVSEDDYEDSGDEAATNEKSSKSSNSGLERNTNALDVLQLQKERREQSRLDSAAKKQKDKEDREKQRQMREEKKEKRKTVKGERRR